VHFHWIRGGQFLQKQKHLVRDSLPVVSLLSVQNWLKSGKNTDFVQYSVKFCLLKNSIKILRCSWNYMLATFNFRFCCECGVKRLYCWCVWIFRRPRQKLSILTNSPLTNQNGLSTSHWLGATYNLCEIPRKQWQYIITRVETKKHFAIFAKMPKSCVNGLIFAKFHKI
jgi:hypothetical protein